MVTGYSYADLRALQTLYQAVKQEDIQPPQVPNELLLCKFKSHSFISLLSQFPKAIQTVYKGLVEQEFESETTTAGYEI